MITSRGGCCWHLVHRGQGYCSTPHRAQDSPHNNDTAPHVNSAKIEKPCPGPQTPWNLRVPCLLLDRIGWLCVRHIADAWMNVQSSCARSLLPALSINSPGRHEKTAGPPSQRSKENFQGHQRCLGLVLSDFQCLWKGGNGIVSKTSTYRI